jgi:hypothetical protein
MDGGMIEAPESAADKPRKVSTSERYRTKIKTQATIIQQQAAELEDLRPKQSRGQRYKRQIMALRGEVEQLETLAHTLLGHLASAIQPGITDANRIRYRCMIQDIRETLQDNQQAAA